MFELYESVYCSNNFRQYVFGLPSAIIRLYPFFKPKNTFSQVHNHIYTFFLHFLIKNPPKNGYTRKQPTHFSMKSSNLNFFKNIFRNLKILKFGMLKKITPKSQAKYQFLTIF